MGTGISDQPDWLERALGSLLAMVLLTAVVWVLSDGGRIAGIDLHALLG